MTKSEQRQQINAIAWTFDSELIVYPSHEVRLREHGIMDGYTVYQSIPVKFDG